VGRAGVSKVKTVVNSDAAEALDWARDGAEASQQQSITK
jgi:hypothetical protein